MAGKLHVLVVDDCPSDRDMIRNLLDASGVDCTTCENGNGAVATFKRTKFDGVILDGHTATYVRIAEIAENAGLHTPIIFFSGDDDMSNLREMWDRGIFVLTKSHASHEVLSSSLGAFIRLIDIRKQHSG